MKYTSRTKKNGSTVVCSKHRKKKAKKNFGQPMVDLGHNGKCVGAGCQKCYKDLPVKELKYE